MSAVAIRCDVSEPVLGLMGSVLGRMAPPPELRVSQFADKELVVTSGPLAGTRWQTSYAPYEREILDVFSEPGIETAVVMGSSQWGKTSIALAIAAYHIAHDPCPILVVEPTLDPMAKDFATNRLDPLIAASPGLRKVVASRREKDASNTKLMKTFRGGFICIAGANSAASLAARPVMVLILDELDRYPLQLPGEGSTIKIAMKRTQTYRGRRRILMLSSPTLKGSPIHSHYLRGDRRRYHVPCPRCGEMHVLRWRNIRWEKGDASTARIHCPECDYGIADAERVAMVQRGEWRPEAPERRDRSIASFHIWEAYSPFSSLEEIVSNFLQAREAQKAGDGGEMHTWQNTTLGEPVEPDRGEGIEAHALLQRLERFESPAPSGVCCLTIGVDTQDDRLEALVVGWGPGEESWLVDRQELTGDPEQPGVWALLDELLGRSYVHASGQRLEILSLCIDSAGHKTANVYEWVHGKGRMGRRVFATIGRSGQRPLVSAPSRKHWGGKPRPVDLYTIGVDSAKALLMGRLSLAEPGPGHVHIPQAEWANDDLAAQLTSERLVTRYSRGMPVQEWRLVRPGQRNEALDCYILALAALRLARVDLNLLAQRLSGAEPPPSPSPPRRRESIDDLGGIDVPDDWLEGRY